MKRLFIRLGLLLVIVSCAALAFGSQVADVAKKEKERRGKTTAPAKVFTNKDIADFKAKQGDQEGSSEVSSEESSGEGEGSETENYDVDQPSDPNNNEAYWRGRYKESTDKVKDLEDKADQLQKDINKLNLNVSNYDGVVAGPQLNAELGRMKEELETINADLATARQELDDLQDEARKGGAEPGWVRE